MYRATNVHDDLGDRVRAVDAGGIGALHRLAKQTGLVDAIDRRVHVLKVHLPYHESDHVLGLAYNALCGGTCLQDIELRRQNEVYLDALGAQRIPDPTTAGDFCRRFDEGDIEALQAAINERRVHVWRQQSTGFFEEAVIDADGTLAETTGERKEGMDIAYNGVWGYHPLVVSLANTQEPLFLVNRGGNRPSSEGAAARFDQAAALCRQAGFRRITFRGDTDFSQTHHLDRWDAAGIRFVFGFDAHPNLVARADAIERRAWRKLERPPTYEVQTEPRARRTNVKAATIVAREFKNLRLLGEAVAEFPYRPAACEKTYRMVVVRKTIAVDQGQQRLFEEIRYFFYLMNDGATDRAADRATQARGARDADARGHLAEQLGVHGDDGARLDVEGLVGVVAARDGPLGRPLRRGEDRGADHGIQGVHQRVPARPRPGCSDLSSGGLSLVGLEPVATRLSPRR
jgi:hypothetical protein